MTAIFYINAFLALCSTLAVIRARNPVHALLFFIASLLFLAVAMFQLGASLPAALEVIVYAGAIMVLFVFVVMLLNMGPSVTMGQSKKRNIGVGVLILLFVSELVVVIGSDSAPGSSDALPSVVQVAKSLFQDYGLLVEIISLVLSAGLVGAYHLGRKSEGNS